MSKRLILGLFVVAGLTAVALWTQAPLAAQAPITSEPASKSPQFGSLQGKKTVEREATVIESNGVVRKVIQVTEAEEQPKTAIEPAKATPYKFGTEVEIAVPKIPADPAKADMQTIYVELHRRLAERLTSEQLTEKCKALEKELNELIAEDEIAELQRQLSELKKKNAENKGVSARIQRAIEALERAPARNGSGETFKSL